MMLEITLSFKMKIPMENLALIIRKEHFFVQLKKMTKMKLKFERVNRNMCEMYKYFNISITIELFLSNFQH